MNKKFSTLMAMSLLVGGSLFSNVDAAKVTTQAELDALLKSGVLELPKGDNELIFANGTYSLKDGYIVIKQEDVKVYAEDGAEALVKGRLIIAKDGVSVKGLNFENTPVDGGYWARNAVSVFADDVTLQDNVFTIKENKTVVGNGIVVFPQNTTVNYLIKDNKVIGAKATDGTWSATGTIILVNSEVNPRTGEPQPLIHGTDFKAKTADVTDGLDAAVIAEGNTFEDCYVDLCQQEGVVINGSNGYYEYAQVTFDADKANNAEAIADVLSASKAATIKGGTAAEVLKALADSDEDFDTVTSAVIVCSDQNLLFGTATAPANGKPSNVVLLDGNKVNAESSAYALGNIEIGYTRLALQEKAGNGYYLLGVKGSDGNTRIVIDATGKLAVADAANTASKAAMWKVSKTTIGTKKTVQYTFENMDGDVLVVASNDGIFTTSGNAEYNKGFVLTAGTSAYNVAVASGNASLVADNASAATYFGLYEVGSISYTVKELIDKRGAGFDMSIATEKDGETTIEGNPFAGVLTPIGVAGQTTDTRFHLTNAAGDYIVLDKTETWSAKTAGLNGKNKYNRGYKFTTVSADDFDKDSKDYLSIFSVDHSAAVADASEITIKVHTASAEFGRLYVATVKGENLLTTSNDINEAINEEEVWPYVTFGGSNLVKGADLLKGYVTMKVANVAKKNVTKGMYIGSTQFDGSQSGVIPTAAVLNAENVDLSKPEGQWAVTLQNASKEASRYTFTNRESKATFDMTLYYTDKEDVYAVSYGALPLDMSKADTLRIEAAGVAAGLQMDGYFNETKEVTRDNAYTISVASAVEGVNDIYLAENHGNKHLVGLTAVAENATQWNLMPYTAARSKANGYQTDSVYIFNNVTVYNKAKDKFESRPDTLAMVSYAIVNSGNDEPIMYSGDQESYKCNEDGENQNGASRFVIKEKNGKYNLVGVYGSTNNYDWSNYNSKLYGAITTADGRIKDADVYQYVANDMFNVTPVASPEYRKVAMNDTISIFRQENDFQYLYEKGEFLNVDNKAQFTKMNPSLFVDTAYVDRSTNNCWQYLLAVNAEKVSHKEDCDIDWHPHSKTDTVYGRFLVNLIDSAVVTYERKLHDNKYINKSEAGEPFAKLGFVWGFHTGDSLYITNGKKGAVKDTLFLGDKNFNQGKFAFRYTDSQDTKAFKIQTRYIDYSTAISSNKFTEATHHNNGYLKWINGTVVVVNNYKLGDEFNMNENENRIPTSNDQIGTSEVSIIAGVGSVVVKNAAGKTVNVSNILGQTIVNTVLTSDNATISVPAGIVVVAVEGEEAVKTVVR